MARSAKAPSPRQAPRPAPIGRPPTPPPRAGRRRASDQLKPGCPFCGAATSAVYRTAWSFATGRYRRRRECAECGETFPTKETLDREQLARDLEARGLTLADVGIDRSLPT